MEAVETMGRLLSRATWAGTRGQVQHVASIPPGAARGLVAEVYSQVERDFGMVAPPITLHAAAPGPLAAAWTMLRETMLVPGSVRRAAKEAVAVAVSLANACPYCAEVHHVALQALAGGRPGGVAGAGLRPLTDWARTAGGDRRAVAPPPAAPEQVPELIGTVVTFQYLNRMVNLFLVESPIPAGVPAAARRVITRMAGRLLRPAFRRPAVAGGSLDLLPAASLPADLSWAAGSPVIGEAFARAAAALEAAGERSVPGSVRHLVTGALAGWDGRPPALGSGWLAEAVASLPLRDRPAGRLALLAALSSAQAGQSTVDEFRRYQPDDRCLIEVSAWASMLAARQRGAWLWHGPDATVGS
jgi:AhpD family alkylhydroperoxidase